MTESTEPVGGFLDLSSNHPVANRMHAGYSLQSGRAAFELMLRSHPPATIWLPRLICDCVVAVVEKCRCDYEFYSIDDQFLVQPNLCIGSDDWLVYVNYLGVNQKQEQETVSRFGWHRVILDRAHALFELAQTAVACIYSPRKFIGIPDGGILVTDLAIDVPLEIDCGSVQRFSHLIKRVSDGPETAYEDFLRAEKSLSESTPRKMSVLTQYLLQSANYGHVVRARKENFKYLHSQLASQNKLSIDLDSVGTPLCYPYWPVDNAPTRESLRAERIYVPQYWPEVLRREGCNQFELSIVEECLALPCDQRYGRDVMDRIIKSLRTAQSTR